MRYRIKCGMTGTVENKHEIKSQKAIL